MTDRPIVMSLLTEQMKHELRTKYKRPVMSQPTTHTDPKKQPPWNKVYRPGQHVILHEDIPATVTGICIRESGVTYEVVWWSDRTRCEKWVQSFEVSPGSDRKRMDIGFRGNGGESDDCPRP